MEFTPWRIEDVMRECAKELDGRVLVVLEDNDDISERVSEISLEESTSLPETSQPPSETPDPTSETSQSPSEPHESPSKTSQEPPETSPSPTDSQPKSKENKIAMRWKMVDADHMTVVVDFENMRLMAKAAFFDKSSLLYHWHLSSELNSPQVCNDCPSAVGTVSFLKNRGFKHLGTIRVSGKIPNSKVELPGFFAAIFSASYRLPNESMMLPWSLGVFKRPVEDEDDFYPIFIAQRCWHCKKPCSDLCKTCKLAIFCSDECKKFAEDIHEQICVFPRLVAKKQKKYHPGWTWV